MNNYKRYKDIDAEDYQNAKTIVSFFISKDDYRKIIDIVKHWRNKKILELGCGSGRFTRYYYAVNDVTCVDINTHLFAIDGVKCLQGNVAYLEEILDINDSFDYVAAFWLTEYLNHEEILSMLKYCKTHLRKSGRIIMTFVTKGIWARIYIWGAFIKRIKKYSYSHKELTSIFEEVGLNMINCYTIGNIGFEIGVLVELS